MKFSEQWLREWVNPSVTAEQLVQQLTMAGLEVDSLEPVAGEFEGVVVGHVLDVQPHPDADRLRVCQVDVGQAEVLTIVCGASNVCKDIKVPVAVIGARLGKDFSIKRAKLRGVESQGMICSLQELGLAESSQGILILAGDAPIGADFREYWQLDDKIISVELTPNRGDCASIIGLAREVAALNDCPKKPLHIPSVIATHEQQANVIISAPEACPRYVGRVITKVNNNLQTPWWLEEKLRRSGLRSINPIVDILNYVMLELGQPMHAFDFAKIKGDIQVRFAKQDESLELLNGQTVNLNSNTLVIADTSKPLAIAGIMGGRYPEVTAVTQDIFLESAFFTPVSLAGKARQYGLHTDSSFRFERGVDPELAKLAIERATALILQIAGGEPGPISERVVEAHIPQVVTVNLREQRIQALLGTTIDQARINAILNSLEMQVFCNETGWEVQVPSHRFDIKLEVDLIEELARIHGYERIKPQPVHGPFTAQTLPETRLESTRISQLLIDRGYHEAITYSFVSPKLNQIFAPEAEPLALSNPLSAELAVMRSHLWPSLLNVLQYNHNRQQERVRLFEMGLRFAKVSGELIQQPVIAGIISGTRYPEGWANQKVDVDFFDVKADIEALLKLAGNAETYSFVATTRPGLHPGQTAKIILAGEVIGYLGALHPSVAEEHDIKSPTYLFEMDLTASTQSSLPDYQPLSKYPSIRRDLALLVDQDLPVAELFTKIKAHAKDIIKTVQLFDVYQGKGIPQGQKSVALGLIMQHRERTLIDEEVNQLLQAIMTDLQQAFQAKLRDE